MKSEKEIFKKAQELKDAENYDEAIELYQSLLENENINQLELLLQLGGSYYFSERYNSAYDHFKLAIKLNPDEEIASLGYYLACVHLDKVEEGLVEMQRYLNLHPPILYKDTIQELLTGLTNGYATEFRDIILGFPINNK